MISELVHLLRDAAGPCGSVDSACVFNPGDDTCGASSAFLLPFAALGKRKCLRGMSAKAVAVKAKINDSLHFLGNQPIEKR